MYISFKQLGTGEYVALSATEITSIPHFSIIDSANDYVGINRQYKAQYGELLKEVFGVFQSESLRRGSNKDISVEILWATEEVKNQPYKANIRLFILVRAIDFSQQEASDSVETVTRLFQSSFSTQKYKYEDVKFSELISVIGNIDDSQIKAIVKNESVENLQNQFYPFCYAYDRFPESEHDLSRIVNVLIDYPNAAFSVQLMPTKFNGAEVQMVDATAQNLETLSKGIMNQGMGNISFTTAQKVAQTFKYYSDNKKGALFFYNILIYGNTKSAESITSRVFGQLSSGEEDSADLKTVQLQKGEVNKDSNFYPLPWAVNEILLGRDRNANIWSTGQFNSEFYTLPYIITEKEAVEFFRLPVGGENVAAGLPINDASQGYKTFSKNIINDGDLVLGQLKSSARNDSIGIRLSDLAKHMLVVGTPGSGKTTFSVGLLDRLWKDHSIPFLVIEPAKNEYRAMVQSIPDLQVFTPGKNFISPFVYNPFVPPKNVKLETYKSTLKTAFAAGVSMTTPLDKIFEESVNNCYSDFRWLDTYTVDSGAEIFNISDFIKCFKETFEAIGYTGDAKNIGRAGEVRLKSLVNLFDNYLSIPIEDMLSKPTVIELAAIENAEEKALIIALLLLSILSYVNANYVGEGGLKNVILLEEAHVLLDAGSSSPNADSNPSAIAQGLVKRMLAEIRSYGVGLVIADQSPRKVGTDVVALTDMKVAFRLVENEDKKIIANSTGMEEVQEKRLAKLKPGEAYLFFNRLEEAEEIVTPDYRMENKISISLSDEGIKKLSSYWNNKQQLLKPYPQCQRVSMCNGGCDYENRILAKEIARRLFKKYFAKSKDKKTAFFFLVKNIEELITQELNTEPYTDKLKKCVYVHLLRNIYYETSMKIAPDVYDKLLSD